MTRYPYLLFDADNTLFDFDEANIHAFRAVCDAFGLPFSQTLFDRFEIINNATWERFDRGELTKDETVLERFRAFFAAEGIRGLDPTACNRVHLASLSNATYLMPHAAEVIAKSVAKAYTSNGATLSVLLYLRAFEDGDFASAWGIGAVLLVLVLAINLAARLAKTKLKQKQ